MSSIKISISSVENKLSKKLENSVSDRKSYKYTYLKQLASRLLLIKSELIVKEYSEEEMNSIIRNALKTERNIANFAANQYAEFNHEELFEACSSLVDDIDEALNME